MCPHAPLVHLVGGTSSFGSLLHHVSHTVTSYIDTKLELHPLLQPTPAPGCCGLAFRVSFDMTQATAAPGFASDTSHGQELHNVPA